TFVGDDQRTFKLAEIFRIDTEIRLQRMLYLHSGRDIDKAAAAEHCAVQSTELIITGRDDPAEPFSEKIRSLLEGVRATHKDHSLIRNCLFDVRIDRLAIKLSFNPGEELPFALGNAEALERLFYPLGNVIPTPLCRLARSEVIADQVEVYFLELVAGPMGRQRFAIEDLVRIFAELAYPVRLALHIDDIVDGLLRQANTGIARRFEIIEKVADIAINIDRSCRVAHCFSSW